MKGCTTNPPQSKWANVQTGSMFLNREQQDMEGNEWISWEFSLIWFQCPVVSPCCISELIRHSSWHHHDSSVLLTYPAKSVSKHLIVWLQAAWLKRVKIQTLHIVTEVRFCSRLWFLIEHKHPNSSDRRSSESLNWNSTKQRMKWHADRLQAKNHSTFTWNQQDSAEKTLHAHHIYFNLCFVFLQRSNPPNNKNSRCLWDGSKPTQSAIYRYDARTQKENKNHTVSVIFSWYNVISKNYEAPARCMKKEQLLHIHLFLLTSVINFRLPSQAS